MKKTNLLLCALCGVLAYGQVGVNTSSPKATLDIMPKNTDGSTAEGLIVPRFTGNELFAAITTGVYSMDQHGAIVYVYTPADDDKQTGQTTHINDYGFYYFDGYNNQWMKMGSAGTIYRTDGILTGPRHMTMDGNNLGFTGGRIGMGTASPDPSGILDLSSTTLGFLPPRMTKVQMNAIAGAALGLQVYCIDCFGIDKGCLMVNDSPNPTSPNWGALCSTNIPTGVIDDLQCGNKTVSGALHAGIPVSGVSVIVPYTGGHSGTYFAGSFNSSGAVTGLVANLPDGFIMDGNGTLPFNITGTPSGAGTASFNITIAGKSCTFTVDVDNFTASVTSIECGNAVFSPSTIIQGQPYSGTLTVPYTGGNGASYSQQQFAQNGLTFTLPQGTLANGNGSFVYNVTGTPTSAITMNIPIQFGSISCNVSEEVTPIITVGMCMGNGLTKVWMAYNLGADTSLDPNPSVMTKGLHGNYYQWGKKDPVATADTGAGAISGWNTTSASNGSWNSGTEDTPVKTAIDPCPSGFRVPTRQEWVSIFNNSNKSTIGTFVNDPTNFGSGIQFTCPGNGNKLTLPASGYRDASTGALTNRGSYGNYWSSTEVSTYAYNLPFDSSNVYPGNFTSRTNGFSVRCIAE
ncbi:hypothetical protein D1631_18475 [Chryseobacterium nematophagum]|uniref:Fibrobacter succinogenes major paralogous domain-containing protein n=1 Tax=Chryseobacterium nematophagum TaxID=2305228 RepID=A0A3M7TE69_9FLAO|nr:FISUMP domain-containing protein [Chryseobacterium nematophagum]RNA60480.1 hypothetical protein D1631_18475 [Chryseobacterium nematophagum]